MPREYVTIRELSKILNLDRSNVRKFVLKQGFSFVKKRTSSSKGQLTLVLSPEDAETIIEMRGSQGFCVKGKDGAIVDNGDGFFYVIQLIPDLRANRVKLGFAGNVEQRLNAHRTSAPTAILTKNWPCKKCWERAAIASITRIECQNIGGEVFECENLAQLLERATAFFKIMP